MLTKSQMESKYFFTSEAYTLYLQLKDKKAFWEYFEKENFFEEYEIIRQFVLNSYFYSLDKSIEYVDYNIEWTDSNTVEDLVIKSFEGPCEMYFNGEKFTSKINFEKAEIIFLNQQNVVDRGKDYFGFGRDATYGRKWWDMFNREYKTLLDTWSIKKI